MDNLTIGLMQSELEEGRRLQLGRIIQQFHYLPCYWILETNTWIGNRLERHFIVSNRRPPKPLLGTVCYYRDNRRMADHEFVRVWCLPLDLPVPDSLIDEDHGGDPNPADDAMRFRVRLAY